MFSVKAKNYDGLHAFNSKSAVEVKVITNVNILNKNITLLQ